MQAKDIAHIWELGGGTALKDLIDMPISVFTVKCAPLHFSSLDQRSYIVLVLSDFYLLTLAGLSCYATNHRSLSIVVVVDLAKPETIWLPLDSFFTAVCQ